MQIERAEIEKIQIQRLSNSKYSQQIQHVATTEKEEQETTATDQICLSSSALTVSKSSRENSRAKNYVRALYQLIFCKNFQNTRVSKRYRLTEADQIAKRYIKLIEIQIFESSDRQKFRRDYY